MAQTKLYKKYKPRIKGLSAAELYPPPGNGLIRAAFFGVAGPERLIFSVSDSADCGSRSQKPRAPLPRASQS